MPEPVVVETHSEDETREFGAELGAVAARGDVLLLLGSFGVGKTTLVQGIGAGLGVEGTVNSPSFVIANEYRGRLPLYHVDLYRIEQMDQTTLEALAEYFGGDGLCVVEWPAPLPRDLVAHAVRIELAVTGETSRRIALLDDGDRFRKVFERRRLVGAGSVPTPPDAPLTCGSESAGQTSLPPSLREGRVERAKL